MTDVWVKDVGDEDFEREVLHSDIPVVADFWAEWCAPCRALGPVLERLAEEHAGGFLLARVDVDRSPRTAARLGIRSIPTVIGFRDGRAVGEFQGAQPESAVRRFLEAVLPSEADRLVERASGDLRSGDDAAARASLEAALEREPHHARALLALAPLLPDREQALGLLDRVAGDPALEQEASRLAARLRTAGGEADLPALEERLARAPDDLAARIALGRGLTAAGRHEEALEALLEAVRRDPDFDDAAARRAMLDVFALLGSDDPLTQRFRSELARVLFR